ncbi:MAG: glycoside hydrolase family 43 protein [Gammaproteobacteria bacterium]|nr:glycoside hydrolase family 43 protein [Gammaproteobacteria bacterium]
MENTGLRVLDYWFSACKTILPSVLALLITSCFHEQNNVQLETYNNPIVKQRADPWIYKHNNGLYYFIATASEFDRIEIRSAPGINGLGQAVAKTIWRKHEAVPMAGPIWAPELHYIDGSWYIYFAAGKFGDPPRIRMYVLSNESADPMQGRWTERGQLVTARDSFSLDATTFEHRGIRYLVWAQRDQERKYNSALYIARMTSPTTIEGPEVMLSEPDLPWEVIGYKVNEGPAVLIKNNRIFLTYSASATDHNYAMGLLWADADADIMNPHSWHKSLEPVFATNAAVNRFGPGHNCFTVAEDGVTDVLVYHARDYRKIEGNPLFDPNRDARARIIQWTADGWPDFNPLQGD